MGHRTVHDPRKGLALQGHGAVRHEVPTERLWFGCQLGGQSLAPPVEPLARSSDTRRGLWGTLGSTQSHVLSRTLQRSPQTDSKPSLPPLLSSPDPSITFTFKSVVHIVVTSHPWIQWLVYLILFIVYFQISIRQCSVIYLKYVDQGKILFSSHLRIKVCISLENKRATCFNIYRSLIWQIHFLNDDEESEGRHTQTATAGSEGSGGGHQDAALINRNPETIHTPDCSIFIDLGNASEDS